MAGDFAKKPQSPSYQHYQHPPLPHPGALVQPAYIECWAVAAHLQHQHPGRGRYKHHTIRNYNPAGISMWYVVCGVFFITHHQPSPRKYLVYIYIPPPLLQLQRALYACSCVPLATHSRRWCALSPVLHMNQSPTPNALTVGPYA